MTNRDDDNLSEQGTDEGLSNLNHHFAIVKMFRAIVLIAFSLACANAFKVSSTRNAKFALRMSEGKYLYSAYSQLRVIIPTSSTSSTRRFPRSKVI